MSDHFFQIYRSQAGEYHAMIAAEDVDGNLPAAMRALTGWKDKRVLDLGSGTGRIPLLLGDEPAQVTALDLHRAMLAENNHQRQRTGGAWHLVQGDMRTLPITTGWADVTVAGWAIGHLRYWFDPHWHTPIEQILAEMLRVTQPQGLLVILETLGTGSLQPAPPSPFLAEYYALLEEEWGFTRQTIATDYQFSSLEEAVARTEFFFGERLVEQIRAGGWQRLPEWTGLWSRRVEAG